MRQVRTDVIHSSGHHFLLPPQYLIGQTDHCLRGYFELSELEIGGLSVHVVESANSMMSRFFFYMLDPSSSIFQDHPV